MTRTRARTLGVASLAATLALAACGGDDEADTTAAPTAATTAPAATVASGPPSTAGDATLATAAADATTASSGSAPAGSASPVATAADATASTDSTPGGTAATDATGATTATEGSTVPVTETVTLLAYDSFPTEGPLNDALAQFTADTGIGVDLVISGDAGTMVSKAVLTAGNPEGDVMFGIDNTFLSRAIDAGVFEPYDANGREALASDQLELVPGNEVTPIDSGDVCVNVDLAWFNDQSMEPPASLDALADPEYRDLLVVENPATSSPGMAFLLATVAYFGEDGWVDYWTRLRDNGVLVVDGWTEAYYEQFTWAGGGDRPLVVSYGSSPPAEVIYADPPVDEAPTQAIESTCFHQVEFAGVLAGTDQPEAAGQLIDFLISDAFQAELPLALFVYPSNVNVELPPEFHEYALRPEGPLSLDPAEISAGRDEWVETWTDTVLG